MSRSWVEAWRIGLAPEAAGVVRVPRFAARAGAAPVRAACAPPAAEAGARAWQPALDAMDQALAQAGAAAAVADVVLSNHFVRYLTIPWQPEVHRLRDLEQLAALRMKQVYGDVAAQWTVRCSEGGYGEPSVACAVDTELVAALGERLAARRLRLRSLQPLLMAAGNQFRRRLGRSGAFAVAESGRLCVGLLHEGTLGAVASRRAGANMAAVAMQELSALGWQPDSGDVALMRVGEAPAWIGNAPMNVRELSAEPRPLALCGLA